MYRANVLSLMPKQFDSQGKWTGKYIANSADLPANAQHTVTLREKTGNSAIQSAGATLFLVYRVTTPALTTPREPLRKIVVYDGLYTAYGESTIPVPEADVMSQHIRGFYKSAGSSVRITHIVGTGGNNQTEKITVQATQQTINIGPPPNSADPFPQTSPSSDRSWGNPTYNLTVPNEFGTPDSTYGATVTTTVSASNTSPAACRAWAAIIYSTEVADVDHDGLPDGLEDAPANAPLSDPDGAELPNLHAMGAASTHPDLFVEYNAMYADPGTTWGSAAAPYPNTKAACYNAGSCTDTVGHHHIPTPEVLTRLGDRYAAHGITVHFDVGKIGNANNCNNDPGYHCLGVVPHTDWVDDYTLPVGTNPNDKYLVPSNLARGGELIKEVACSSGDPQCNFPDYPGTVGWKVGFLALRNAPVGNNGEELNPDLTGPNGFKWVSPASQHRLRFDRERRPYFHYGLNAHTRGTRVPRCPVWSTGSLPTICQTVRRAGRPIIPSFMFRPVPAVSPICLGATCC